MNFADIWNSIKGAFTSNSAPTQPEQPRQPTQVEPPHDEQPQPRQIPQTAVDFLSRFPTVVQAPIQVIPPKNPWVVSWKFSGAKLTPYIADAIIAKIRKNPGAELGPAIYLYNPNYYDLVSSLNYEVMRMDDFRNIPASRAGLNSAPQLSAISRAAVNPLCIVPVVLYFRDTRNKGAFFEPRPFTDLFEFARDPRSYQEFIIGIGYHFIQAMMDGLDTSGNLLTYRMAANTIASNPAIRFTVDYLLEVFQRTGTDFYAKTPNTSALADNIYLDVSTVANETVGFNRSPIPTIDVYYGKDLNKSVNESKKLPNRVNYVYSIEIGTVYHDILLNSPNTYFWDITKAADFVTTSTAGTPLSVRAYLLSLSIPESRILSRFKQALEGMADSINRVESTEQPD